MLQTVLVVDDSPAVIALVDETLRTDYRVRVASSGASALAALQRDPEVDLILLDVIMPEMDGFETCRRIKASEEGRDIPIIFLTALSENDDEAYGLNLGAVDYIAKPVIPVTLRARVHTQMELCRVRQALQKSNNLLSAEREVIEGMILRMRADSDFDDRHLRGLMRPVERTSGDICLAAFCPEGRQIVLVGDFTGHGLTAAMGGGAVKQAFYALCRSGASLSELAAALNGLLCAHLLTRRQIRLWGGGMHPPLHVDSSGQCRQILLGGFPLGLRPGQDISDEVRCLDVRPGERLLLYSDGSIEAMNGAGERYEIDRLAACYAKLLHSGGALAELAADVDAFVAGREQKDDMVFLELRL
jgi:CheY-like chemotaxis protein